MPDRSEKVQRLNEETGQYELPYISKSRIKQWVENPEHFRLKYLEGIVEPETEAMRRGTDIHKTFEEYYRNARDADQPVRVVDLLPEKELWADYIEPYISNFLVWEQRRKQHVDGVFEDYAPVAVEEERWRDGLLGIDGEPEWMGIADAVIPARGVPQCDEDEGVVIVDFKTGSVPDKKYRSKGIYTELQYYIMVFEDEYDIAGAGAYYPKEDEFIMKPHGGPYRDTVLRNAGELVAACRDYDGGSNFEADPGPLCKWGPGDDEQSAYYGVCSQCTWGVPVNNQATFEAMIDEGYDDDKIADELGTSKDAVNYWKYKLGL